MFCPQCGAQPAPQTKFCKACGLKLAEFEAWLETREQTSRAQRDLRNGTGFLLVSLLLAGLAFLLSGLLRLRLPDTPELEPLWAVCIFSAFPLLTGFGGLGFLWRGGFFKNFRKQHLQHEIEELEQELEKKRRQLEAQRERQLAAPSISIETLSITEHTTRELQPQPSNSGKIA